MPPTYRDLRDVMSKIDMRKEISPWAERYAVGDEIAFRVDGDVDSAPVAGFSSLEEYAGCPVIVIPDRLTHLFKDAIGTAAIPESHHVLPEDNP